LIGIDTNILVRYIAQYDPLQSPKATRLMEALSTETPGFVSLVALVELVWVLTGRYRSSRADIALIVETLLRTREIRIEQSDTVWKSVRLFASSKADFADCLIERSGYDAQCDYTATFDIVAAKTVGMRLAD